MKLYICTSKTVPLVTLFENFADYCYPSYLLYLFVFLPRDVKSGSKSVNSCSLPGTCAILTMSL